MKTNKPDQPDGIEGFLEDCGLPPGVVNQVNAGFKVASEFSNALGNEKSRLEKKIERALNDPNGVCQSAQVKNHGEDKLAFVTSSLEDQELASILAILNSKIILSQFVDSVKGMDGQRLKAIIASIDLVTDDLARQVLQK